ncbi:hypothetical protein FJY71_01215 [candidate division WOR-3 bacterium]|nr:hypothetical protein [candidate division WOR-3 bacterium]
MPTFLYAPQPAITVEFHFQNRVTGSCAYLLSPPGSGQPPPPLDVRNQTDFSFTIQPPAPPAIARLDVTLALNTSQSGTVTVRQALSCPTNQGFSIDLKPM